MVENGKVVIITGATSGIGKACAKKFVQQGWNVVITGRDETRLKIVMEEFKELKEKTLAVKSDVSAEENCKVLVNETMKKFGRIDALINNAGISMRALFEEMDLDVFRKVMGTNFYGTVYCTKYALPFLLKTKGSVVGISSIAGKKGLPGRIAYSSSKFAMEGFLETLRTENLKKGLHVLVACPGFTATQIRNNALSKDGSIQMESPRDESKMMSADEVATHIYTAVVKRKRDLVLTTGGKLTVWLNKFFPAIMDKVVYKHMAKEPGAPF